jgi:hypothetical protein
MAPMYKEIKLEEERNTRVQDEVNLGKGGGRTSAKHE